MSNIFNFRPRKKNAPNSDFLKDEDDSVEFGPTGQDVNLPRTPAHYLQDQTAAFMLRDWDNQELANIYRVKKLLDAAGVPNELERGVSDEGDPWCIFCMTTGDVFIHLSRFDGLYILDSPNLRKPITGVDFADLIAEFSAGALRRTPEVQKGSGQVIKLERNGKIFLHPATLLAALIWSIYLNSEELVMLAPEGGLGSDADLDAEAIALLNETALAPLAGEEAATAAAFLDSTALNGTQAGNLRVAVTNDDLRETASLKDLAHKAGAFVAAPTPIAVGLSSIALAFGLVTEGIFDTAPASVDVADAETVQPFVEADIATAERDVDTLARTAPFDIATVLHAAFDHGSAAPAAQTSGMRQAEASGDLNLDTITLPALAQPVQTDLPIALGSGAAFQKNWDDDLELAALFAPETQASETAETEGDATPLKTTGQKKETVQEAADAVPEADPLFDMATLFNFDLQGSGTFQTYDVAGLTIKSSFDLSLLQKFSEGGTEVEEPAIPSDPVPVPVATPVVPVTPVDPPTVDPVLPIVQPPDPIDQDLLREPDEDMTFKQVDLNARQFFDHLFELFKLGEVHMTETVGTGDISFYNLDAMFNAPLEVMNMKWKVSDGSTVEVIGVKSDFEAFDLIA